MIEMIEAQAAAEFSAAVSELRTERTPAVLVETAGDFSRSVLEGARHIQLESSAAKAELVDAERAEGEASAAEEHTTALTKQPAAAVATTEVHQTIAADSGGVDAGTVRFKLRKGHSGRAGCSCAGCRMQQNMRADAMLR